MFAFRVLVLLSAALAVCAEDAPPAPSGQAAECGDPIDAGFFFWNGRYVQAPYTVERKGLDIFINGILVSRGPQAPVAAPKEDPGEPPPGASPFDQFFGDKWRYLSSRYGPDEATLLMLQAYQKCGGFSTEAEPDGTIKVTENGTGEETRITLSDSWKMAPSTPEQILAGRATRRRYFEQLLRRNRVVSLFDGGEHIMAGSDADKTLAILLSEETPQGKIRALERRGILKPEDTAAQCIVTEYRENAQLSERYGRLLHPEPLADARGSESPSRDRQDRRELAQRRDRLLTPVAAESEPGPPAPVAGSPQARAQAGVSSWRTTALTVLLALLPCAFVLLVWRRRRGF